MQLVKQWFVLHVLTSHELKVKRYIEAQRRALCLDDYIGEVVIPTERVSEVRNGKKVNTTRKFFPGYVFANLALYPEGDIRKPVVAETWKFLQEVPGCLGFVGHTDHPLPMLQKEVDALFNQDAAGKEKVRPKVSFSIGEMVRINDGPFVGLNGEIVEVDPDRGRITAEVVIFGRPTRTELEYYQAERLTDAAK
ncbi:MAG: transcription termination/antitermination protein NusG [Kiritimatiellia bacterium]|nr:transcription termination/antitermination protein NusG [Kiritimatiellia bacterium]